MQTTQASDSAILQPTSQPTILSQSSHPTALVFHLLFRTAALFIYLFCGWFGLNYVFTFVLIVILLALDFWTVKNITGRLLVGLRWWNQVNDDGTNTWVFESRESRVVNVVDSRMFWISLYLTPAVWAFFAFIVFLNPTNWQWLLVDIVAIVLNMANVVGYTRCEKVRTEL